VILYLHGAGMRGGDVERLRSAGLPHLLESTQTFPFIVASPLCPTARSGRTRSTSTRSWTRC
jgi:hypothetical protein